VAVTDAEYKNFEVLLKVQFKKIYENWLIGKLRDFVSTQYNDTEFSSLFELDYDKSAREIDSKVLISGSASGLKWKLNKDASKNPKEYISLNNEDTEIWQVPGGVDINTINNELDKDDTSTNVSNALTSEEFPSPSVSDINDIIDELQRLIAVPKSSSNIDIFLKKLNDPPSS